MLAGRLIRSAKDILDEYSRFKISEQLAAAANLSSRRGSLEGQQYITQARQLRQWAQAVIEQTKIGMYPSDLLTFLKDSQYSPALPERIATVILQSFPDDVTRAILSPELNLYIQQVQNLRNELGALVSAGQKLNIDEVEIPPESISLDVIMPRSVFNGNADEFINVLDKFVGIMSSLIELTTGSKSSPIVTYTSASAIVTGLALGYGAAWSFLTLYKLFLEVVEKHLSILKTIKELRAASLDTKADSDLEARAKEFTERALAESVEKTVAVIDTPLQLGRANELKIALNKDGHYAIQAIANGARIGITIEALDQIPKISEAVSEATVEQIDKLLKQERLLERQVDHASAALEGTRPMLLAASDVDKRG